MSAYGIQPYYTSSTPLHMGFTNKSIVLQYRNTIVEIPINVEGVMQYDKTLTKERATVIAWKLLYDRVAVMTASLMTNVSTPEELLLPYAYITAKPFYLVADVFEKAEKKSLAFAEAKRKRDLLLEA